MHPLKEERYGHTDLRWIKSNEVRRVEHLKKSRQSGLPRKLLSSGCIMQRR